MKSSYGTAATASAARADAIIASLAAIPPAAGIPAGPVWLENGWELTTRLREHGLARPTGVLHSEGLGAIFPPAGFGVRDVARAVGEERPLEVMAVGSQNSEVVCPYRATQGWTVGAWADWYCDPARRRTLLNVISLEFSRTPLARLVRAPAAVRALSWASQTWPSDYSRRGALPQVTYYCLMSPAGAWTDWHLDFGGTGVWYHLHTGMKTFLFAPPTTRNLDAFVTWGKSPAQDQQPFASMPGLEGAFSVDVAAGQTLLIPAGWLHAVVTRKDSLVFGGNYLAYLDVPTQLAIRDVEIRLRIARKFTFPHWEALHWFAAAYAVCALTNRPYGLREQAGGATVPVLGNAERAGLLALAAHLRTRLAAMEQDQAPALPPGPESVGRAIAEVDAARDAAGAAIPMGASPRQLVQRLAQLAGGTGMVAAVTDEELRSAEPCIKPLDWVAAAAPSNATQPRVPGAPDAEHVLAYVSVMDVANQLVCKIDGGAGTARTRCADVNGRALDVNSPRVVAARQAAVAEYDPVLHQLYDAQARFIMFGNAAPTDVVHGVALSLKQPRPWRQQMYSVKPDPEAEDDSMSRFAGAPVPASANFRARNFMASGSCIVDFDVVAMVLKKKASAEAALAPALKKAEAKARRAALKAKDEAGDDELDQTFTPGSQGRRGTASRRVRAGAAAASAASTAADAGGYAAGMDSSAGAAAAAAPAASSSAAAPAGVKRRRANGGGKAPRNRALDRAFQKLARASMRENG